MVCWFLVSLRSAFLPGGKAAAQKHSRVGERRLLLGTEPSTVLGQESASPSGRPARDLMSPRGGTGTSPVKRRLEAEAGLYRETTE